MKRLSATVLLPVCALFALATTTACDKNEGKADVKSGAKEEKKVELKPIGDLFPSKVVMLPPPLAKLTFGMPDAEANKVMPGITDKLVDLEAYKDVYVGSHSDEKGGDKFLRSVRISFPKEAGDIQKLLTDKWGAPRTVKELSDTIYVWFNAEAGIRARLKPGFGDKKDLEFSAYLPFEKLLGPDKTKFGFEDKPLLGMDLPALASNYKDVLEVLSKEEAQKKRAKMKAMFGDALNKLGDAQASTDIHLLPTELGSYRTTVWPRFDKKTGKIISVRMTVPFEGEEGGSERLMAAMKKAWGEPKEEEKYGKKLYVFSEEPFLTVEDSIGRSWEIERQPKRR